MQTINSAQPSYDSTPVIRWSAVSAGVVVALGILASLYALGVSTGMAAFDIYKSGNAKHVGIFVGAFGAVAPFIALFAGGFVAGRGAGAVRASVGFLHGLTVWGISAIALLWLTYNLVAAAAGGAFAVGKGVAQAGQGLVQAGGSALADGVDGVSNLKDLAHEASQQVQKHVELDADSLMEPVNALLKKNGRKPLSTEQLERAARAIGKKAMAEKKIDRDLVIDSITHETNIDRADAEAVADLLVDKYKQAKEALDEKVKEAKQQLEEARAQTVEELEKAANQTAEAASKAFGGLFLALALGALAAGAGATLAAKSNAA